MQQRLPFEVFIHFSVKPGQTGKLTENTMKTERLNNSQHTERSISKWSLHCFLTHSFVGWECPKANNLPGGGEGVEAGFKLCSARMWESNQLCESEMFNHSLYTIVLCDYLLPYFSEKNSLAITIDMPMCGKNQGAIEIP